MKSGTSTGNTGGAPQAAGGTRAASSHFPALDAGYDAAQLEAHLVQQLGTGLAALPLLPQAAAEALRLANDPNAEIGDLANLVEKDPPIAARLLSFANSAVYARGKKTTDARGAILRLGLSGARDLLFQVVYASSMLGLPRYQAEVANSFRRSVLAGIVTRFLSEQLGESHPYDYLCGLLHDIGEGRVYRILAAKPVPTEGFPAVEAMVARHHASAGAELARTWRLPDDIAQSCREHHGDPASAEGVIRLVAIADALVPMAEAPAGAKPSETLLERLQILRLSPELLAPSIAKIKEAARLL